MNRLQICLILSLLIGSQQYCKADAIVSTNVVLNAEITKSLNYVKEYDRIFHSVNWGDVSIMTNKRLTQTFYKCQRAKRLFNKHEKKLRFRLIKADNAFVREALSLEARSLLVSVDILDLQIDILQIELKKRRIVIKKA